MSKVAKTAVGLMIITIMTKILGFAREQVLSYVYGASMYTDVYITSMNIPTVIFASIGVALSTTFIPLYCKINIDKGEKDSLKFTNNVMNIVLIICSIIAIVGFIYTEPLVKLFAIGFKGEKLRLAVEFTRVLIIGIVFIGITNIMTAYLQVKNNFIIPGIISLPQNIIIIISIILSIKLGAKTIVWGSLIGMMSQFVFLLPFAAKRGYKYSININIKDENIRKMIWLVGPVFIGVAVNQINTMVDRTLASTLIDGSISSLNYANRLVGFILGMFIASIGAVIYPMLSKLSIDDDRNEFNKSIVNSINSIIILVIPISVGAIILSNPIVKLLFERGAFDENATKMTSIALTMYAIGMTASGLRDILGKVFYSLQDTKTPMVNGVIGVLVNISLNIILIKFMGHAGLALGTSISSIVCILLLFNKLKNKIGNFGQKRIIKTLLKSILGSIIMGLFTYNAYNIIENYLGNAMIFQILVLSLSIGIGVTIYLIILSLLKVDEIKYVINIIKK